MTGHDRFFEMLSQVDRINYLWDVKTKELKLEAFESALCVMSSGEVAMAKFFASVWFNDNKKYGFDLVDAVSCIDVNERELIIEWIKDPFWP